jgi:4-hydroxybenzoate polyprenyltransferase
MSTYFILQLAYTKLLKNIVIVDVMVIATGFVLRVIAGSEIINVKMSSWLLICSFLLALFLSLSKRRSELTSVPENSHLQRKVLTKYSPYLLDQMISVVTSSTFIAYILYTISDETVKRIGTKNLIFTIPFVMFGIFRYLYLIHKKEEGERPEITMLTDLPLIFIIFLWICSLYIIIY